MTVGLTLAKRHPQQIEDADSGTGGNALNVQTEIASKDREKDQTADQQRKGRDDPDHVPYILGEKHHIAQFRLSE